MTEAKTTNYQKRLSTYVEVISDEFESTFTVVDEDTLVNMLGFPDDFRKLTKIIQKYLPGVQVWFSRSGNFDENYDMHFIKAICRE